MAELARISAVSEAHFARSFRDAFGLPPHRYLLARRIERAKALLGETKSSIAAIAFETGWKSLGSFGRTFRDVTGESPSEHRARGTGAAAEEARVQVPACVAMAAARPHLKIAVSEKRRRTAVATPGAHLDEEVP